MQTSSYCCMKVLIKSHMQSTQNLFCRGRVSVFLATSSIKGEVLWRTCEHAWVLLTEVVMTRWLQLAWDINHNCWGLHKCDVFFPLARTQTSFLLHEGRNVDFSVLVSKTPDVFMFSIRYDSSGTATAEEEYTRFSRNLAECQCNVEMFLHSYTKYVLKSTTHWNHCWFTWYLCWSLSPSMSVKQWCVSESSFRSHTVKIWGGALFQHKAWFVLSNLWEGRRIPCWKPVWVDLCSRCTLDWPDAHTHTLTHIDTHTHTQNPITAGKTSVPCQHRKLLNQIVSAVIYGKSKKCLTDKIIFGGGNRIIMSCTLCWNGKINTKEPSLSVCILLEMLVSVLFLHGKLTCYFFYTKTVPKCPFKFPINTFKWVRLMTVSRSTCSFLFS